MPILIIYPVFALIVYYILFKKTKGAEFKTKVYYFSFISMSFFLQIFSIFLIYQDAIFADEKGIGGDIFGNMVANTLIFISFLAIIITLVSPLNKMENKKN